MEVDCVQGAMLLVKTNVFCACGGYDEDIFLYGEEISLGFSIKRMGYKTFLVTDCEYNHSHSQSITKSIPNIITKRKLLHDSKKIILKKNWKLNYYHNLAMFFIFKLNLIELRIKEKLNI